jgi:colicin import membrane protein
MRETRVDTTYAIALALLLHAIPLALFLLAALWPGQDAASAGEPIQAEIFDLNALSASTRSALRRPPEPMAQPEPQTAQEPPPEALPEPMEEITETPPETPPEQQLKPQEQVPDPQETRQEEVKPDSESEETAEREQEARRMQGQRDLTENRETQEEMEQRRMTEMERQRQQQLADIRRQRAEAARQASLSEERLRQLADRRAQQASSDAADATGGTPAPGNRGTEPDSSAAYAKAIADAIRRNWIRPDNILPNQRCRIVIRQLPGGEVIDAQVDASCPYDELGRRSVEAAVLKAQPLPYPGFEKVFQRTLILNFQAEDR